MRPKADLAELARLHALCFEDAWSAKALEDLLKTPGVSAFSAEQGFILIRVASDEAEVLTIAVAPSARRKGTASALLAEAMRDAAAGGSRTMFLEVAATNQAAIALYTKLGFRKVGTRKAYYAPSEDALILRVELPFAALGK
ncbi:MAG TPA: ribosomal protein S18-alanine N-acetyltransferase [Rhizomicrobium sp.]|nr:ribosomal protein S18-alanine N-acetyltransferase [Rhizomicrobium sp.]